MGKDERTPEDIRAHNDLLKAGLDYYNIASIGDTSQMETQANAFANYITMQGLDPEKDFNGLPRHVALFGQLIPKEEEAVKEKLLNLTDTHLAYALGGLRAEAVVGLAARLGTSKEELALEERLSDPKTELKDIKETFSATYGENSLVSRYIALNPNQEEVTYAANRAIEREAAKRQANFIYQTKDKKIRFKSKEAKDYIATNLEKTEGKIGEEIRMGLGLNLATIQLQKQAKADDHQEKKAA